MNNNGHKCNFNADIVSYLYGEAEAVRQSAFDAHLQECSVCREEVEELSFARVGISDWKAAEFSTLDVPRVLIPTNETAAASWLDRLRALISMHAGIAGAAAAVLVAIFGVTWFASLGPVVEVSKVTNISPAASETSAFPADPPTPEAKIAAVQTQAPGDLTAKNTLGSRKAQNRAVSQERSVKVSSPPVSTVAGSARTKRPETPPGPGRALPTLTSFEEEADESLRLADLLSQADTDGTDE